MNKRANTWDERRAFVDSLLQILGDPMYAYALSLTKNKEAAEWLFEESMARAYQKRGTYRPKADLDTWLRSQFYEVWHSRGPEYLKEHGQPEDAAEPAAIVNREEAVESETVEEEGQPAPECVPPLLLARTHQRLRAESAQLQAQLRHRGPLWTHFGMAVLAVVALGCIAYGVDRPAPTVTAATTAANRPNSNLHLPAPLQNLPVNVLAQYDFQGSDLAWLKHMTAAKDAVYMANLNSGQPGPNVVTIQKCPFTKNGDPFASSLVPVADVNLIPPVVSTSTSSSSSQKQTLNGWQLEDWSFHTTGDWGVLVVTWRPVNASQGYSVKQIYTVYLPSGQFALVKSLVPQSNQNDLFAIAVGNGKLAIQDQISGPSAVGPSPFVDLPVEVYTLTGTDPVRALGKLENIEAPTGLMESPVMTANGIAFQGLGSEPTSPSAVYETWYQLLFTGQLIRYIGAPVDGQPHWIVLGTSGRLWWVETTPDTTSGAANQVQVLMAPLLDVSSTTAETPAETLSGSVMAFHAEGPNLFWIQKDGNSMQLVVSQAQ